MPDTLSKGEQLAKGAQLFSKNMKYALTHQGDGNVVLYGPNGAVLWTTESNGQETDSLLMQEDGNFVLYGAGEPKWASNTVGSGAERLVVQNDGNVVLYTPEGAAWATNTVQEGNAPSKLVAGEQLGKGGVLESDNQQYTAVMQPDGNFVVYAAATGEALWASGTQGSGADCVIMQGDGNLVVYGDGEAKWASNTADSGANTLLMQDDGNLVVYADGGVPKWARM